MADLGIDVHCIEDFLPNMPEVSGETGLGHGLARRLQTPRGLFPWWPDYGTDVSQFLLSKAPLNSVASAIQTECEKDERVESVEVEVVQTGTSYVATIRVESAEGPFEFVFLITTEKVALLTVN